jgi:hypothetical protein
VSEFFRIIEQVDGWWYRRGRADLKRFSTLDDAIGHVTDIASEHPPSEVLVHHLDGQVQVIATFD